MATMNRVFLAGNLTRNPELRKTAAGIAVSDLGLAINEKHRTKAGEIVETVCYAEVVVWGRQAETCCQYLTKGSPVIVEGRLQLHEWQTDNGEKRSKLRINADRVQFLGRLRAEAAEGGAEGKPSVRGDEHGEAVAIGKEGEADDGMPF